MKAPQAIAVGLLGDLGVRVSTRKPNPHPEKFIVVSRIGGGNDDWATKDPRFLIESFAKSEYEAEALAESARDLWRCTRTKEVLWATADDNLARFDDPDPDLHRFQFTGGLKLKFTQ